MRLTHLKKLPRRNSPAVPLDIRWQDEARVGQKNSMLGQTRHTACGRKRPAHKIRLDIRGDLSRPGWPLLSCRTVIHAGCKGTSKKYRHRSNPVPMLSSSLTRPDGTPPANWIFRTISPCCRYRHAARPPSKMSGNICGKTGCQTGSLTIRTRSFPSVVTHGTTSPKDHRKSGPLDTENGHMGSNFQELL